jgi:hypothetical protein
MPVYVCVCCAAHAILEEAAAAQSGDDQQAGSSGRCSGALDTAHSMVGKAGGRAALTRGTLAVLRWLQPLCQLPQLRSLACERLLLPPGCSAPADLKPFGPTTTTTTELLAKGCLDGNSAPSASAAAAAVAEQLSAAAADLAAMSAQLADIRDNSGSSDDSSDNSGQCTWSSAAIPPSAKGGVAALLLRLLVDALPFCAPTPSSGVDPEGRLLTEAVTLLLLLLYDETFKHRATLVLLDRYDWLLTSVGDAGALRRAGTRRPSASNEQSGGGGDGHEGGEAASGAVFATATAQALEAMSTDRRDTETVAEALTAALDRLTVQLFNQEQVRLMDGDSNHAPNTCVSLRSGHVLCVHAADISCLKALVVCRFLNQTRLLTVTTSRLYCCTDDTAGDASPLASVSNTN